MQWVQLCKSVRPQEVARPHLFPVLVILYWFRSLRFIPAESSPFSDSIPLLGRDPSRSGVTFSFLKFLFPFLVLYLVPAYIFRSCLCVRLKKVSQGRFSREDRKRWTVVTYLVCNASRVDVPRWWCAFHFWIHR